MKTLLTIAAMVFTAGTAWAQQPARLMAALGARREDSAEHLGGTAPVRCLSFLVSMVAAAIAAVTPAIDAQILARVDPAAAGWDQAALAEVLGYAQTQRSTGFLIIQNSRTVAEANWPLGADATAFRNNFVHGTAADGALLEDVASQQKSYVAILVGIAIDKGLLDISKPVSAYARTAWSKASAGQEAGIAVRHLLMPCSSRCSRAPRSGRWTISRASG